MAKSNYLENKVIDHFLGTSSTSAPSNVYMGLFTSNPTDANSGTEVSNLLYHGALTDDKVIEDGDSLVVASGAITITET